MKKRPEIVVIDEMENAWRDNQVLPSSGTGVIVEAGAEHDLDELQKSLKYTVESKLFDFEGLKG